DLAVLPERPLVLTIGRLVEQKGLDTLLAAAPVIADRRPEPVIAIAWDGPLWGSLHDTAAELDADVRMLGHRTDVADLLAAADVFCLPSHWEGSSLVVMEALRAGLPVVGTRVGGISELYSGTAVLVPPGEPEAFAAAVGQVLDDTRIAEDLRKRSGEAAAALLTAEVSVDGASKSYTAVAAWCFGGGRGERSMPLRSDFLAARFDGMLGSGRRLPMRRPWPHSSTRREYPYRGGAVITEYK